MFLFLGVLPVKVFGAIASPVFCAAPFPGEVRRLALAAGASFLCCRPSSRSFSRWVCVVFFRSRSAASSFAVPVAGLLSGSEFSCGSGFCLVRSSGGWFRVSVPVAVEAFSPVSGLCPCFWVAL